MQNAALWSRLEAYQFRPEDPDNTPRGRPMRASIEARLQESENWADDYIEDVLMEYRRFLYLARISPGQATPSDIIDRAWHAHMADSRDYIDLFCRRVFGEIQHHEPCIGPEEMPRYHAQYEATRALYAREFGAEPPADIWESRSPAEQAADKRRARLAGLGAVAIGAAIFAIAWLAFGWRFGAVFTGFAVGAIAHVVLTPMVPGPRYRRSDSSSGAGGCSGCGGCGG